MAQMEVGLAIGEPPVSKGYTPSVFAMLPRLLERGGNGQKGSITGLYTVLVDGDDMNEPISDAVRGILDGHIVLSRKLANKYHFPAIDVLASISRLMPQLVDKAHLNNAGAVKELVAVYKEAEDLISNGAYKKGNDPKIDRAIDYIEKIDGFLKQDMNENVEYETTLERLHSIIC